MGQLELSPLGIYRDDEPDFRLKLALTVIALIGIETGEIPFELGKGDAGKRTGRLLGRGDFRGRQYKHARLRMLL